jgi:HEAT repeat protein
MSSPGEDDLRAAGERLREAQVLQNKQDSAPIVADLRKLGFDVEWIDELYNNHLDYRTAIPTLLDWLPRVSNPDVKADIVRALSVRWAKPKAAPLLVKEFARAPDELGLRWAIGNALSVVADDSVFEEVVRLVRDRRHGRSREMVAVALGNMKNPRAVDVLLELLEEEQLAGHALIGLGKLKPEKAREAATRLLDHSKAWVRKEAAKLLAKLDKAAGRTDPPKQTQNSA